MNLLTIRYPHSPKNAPSILIDTDKRTHAKQLLYLIFLTAASPLKHSISFSDPSIWTLSVPTSLPETSTTLSRSPCLVPMVQPNLGRIAPIIRERFLPFLLAQHYDRSLAHVYGQRAEAMLLTAPPWPRDDLRLIPQTRPPALWQVELDVIVFGEDGRLRRRTAGRTQAMRSGHAGIPAP